jgi:hypothetical protein
MVALVAAPLRTGRGGACAAETVGPGMGAAVLVLVLVLVLVVVVVLLGCRRGG